MYTAQLPDKGAFVIRYPKGNGVFCHCEWEQPFREIAVGKGRCLKNGNDLAILSLGTIGNSASKAITAVENARGISIAHYDMDNVFSEVMWLYDKGFRYWFVDSEIEELHKQSTGFHVQTIEYEMLMRGFECPSWFLNSPTMA